MLSEAAVAVLRLNVELGAIQVAVADEDLAAAARATSRLRTILALREALYPFSANGAS